MCWPPSASLPLEPQPCSQHHLLLTFPCSHVLLTPAYLGDQVLSNGAERCPHRHSPVLVTWLSWQLLGDEVKAGTA